MAVREQLRSLRELAQRGDYEALARAAQVVAEDTNAECVEVACATLLHAYALVRVDAHRHAERAFAMAEPAMNTLLANRQEDPENADWANLMWAYMLQFVRRDSDAEGVLRELLARPHVSTSNRLAAMATLAHSLTEQHRLAEARAALMEAGERIDNLPADQRSPWIARERERIRLNLADQYLGDSDAEAATLELDAIDLAALTPIMRVSWQVSKARIALMHQEWDNAESLAHEANAGALAVGYAPLRADALGVLVAVAAIKGRLDEQRRLVLEMASFLTEPQ